MGKRIQGHQCSYPPRVRRSQGGLHHPETAASTEFTFIWCTVSCKECSQPVSTAEDRSVHLKQVDSHLGTSSLREVALSFEAVLALDKIAAVASSSAPTAAHASVEDHPASMAASTPASVEQTELLDNN